MVGALDSGASCPDFSHGHGCIVGKALYPHSASLHIVPLSYKWVLANLMQGGNPVMD